MALEIYFSRQRIFNVRRQFCWRSWGESFWKNVPVTAGYSRRAVEGSEFGVPVELCPGLCPDGKVVVEKLHAHRWAGGCLLASKWALLPRLCDISPVDLPWLRDLWAQHRVGLVP